MHSFILSFHEMRQLLSPFLSEKTTEVVEELRTPKKLRIAGGVVCLAGLACLFLGPLVLGGCVAVVGGAGTGVAQWEITKISKKGGLIREGK